MIDVDSEAYKELERRCKTHNPPYDPERMIQLANAMYLMTVVYHRNSRRVKNVTCFKSKKCHLKTRNHMVDF